MRSLFFETDPPDLPPPLGLWASETHWIWADSQPADIGRTHLHSLFQVIDLCSYVYLLVWLVDEAVAIDIDDFISNLNEEEVRGKLLNSRTFSTP